MAELIWNVSNKCVAISQTGVNYHNGRLRWFRHLECENEDDWMSACRSVEVAGEKCRGRKTWRECENVIMKLHCEWAIFRDMWRDFIMGKHLTLATVYYRILPVYYRL